MFVYYTYALYLCFAGLCNSLDLEEPKVGLMDLDPELSVQR